MCLLRFIYALGLSLFVWAKYIHKNINSPFCYCFFYFQYVESCSLCVVKSIKYRYSVQLKSIKTSRIVRLLCMPFAYTYCSFLGRKVRCPFNLNEYSTFIHWKMGKRAANMYVMDQWILCNRKIILANANWMNITFHRSACTKRDKHKRRASKIETMNCADIVHNNNIVQRTQYAHFSGR